MLVLFSVLSTLFGLSLSLCLRLYRERSLLRARISALEAPKVQEEDGAVEDEIEYRRRVQ